MGSFAADAARDLVRKSPAQSRHVRHQANPDQPGGPIPPSVVRRKPSPVHGPTHPLLESEVENVLDDEHLVDSAFSQFAPLKSSYSRTAVLRSSPRLL